MEELSYYIRICVIIYFTGFIFGLGWECAKKLLKKQELDELEKAVRKEGVREGIQMVKLPTYDHSKCPLPLTCIGYQNAESDLENEKRILLKSLTTK